MVTRRQNALNHKGIVRVNRNAVTQHTHVFARRHIFTGNCDGTTVNRNIAKSGAVLAVAWCHGIILWFMLDNIKRGARQGKWLRFVVTALVVTHAQHVNQFRRPLVRHGPNRVTLRFYGNRVKRRAIKTCAAFKHADLGF